MSSDLKVTNIKHESSSSNNLVLGSDGSANIDGLNIKDSALVTDTNKYAFVKGGELNSLGFLDRIFFGSSYYLSSSKNVDDATWTHIDSTWSKISNGVNGTTTGSTDADPMGKFSSGIWTPSVAGYYLCMYAINIPGIYDADQFISVMGKNWTSGGPEAGKSAGYSRQFGSGNNQVLANSGSGILALGTTDNVKLLAYQTTGGTQPVRTGETIIGFYYLGKNII